MKRLARIAVALCFAPVAASLLLPAAPERIVLRIKAAVANVRSRPDPAAPVVARVRQSDLLPSSGREGDWHRVSAVDSAGRTVNGYIHASVVEETAAPPAPVQAEPSRKRIEAKPAPAPPTIAEAGEESGEVPARPAQKEYLGRGVRLLGGIASGRASHSPTYTYGYTSPAAAASLAGFCGGVGYETGRRLSLGLEILYQKKGARYAGTAYEDGNEVRFEEVVHLDEVSVPLLARWRPFRGPTPVLLAGVEAGWLIAAEHDWSFSIAATADADRGTIDLMPVSRRLDFGLVGGLGFEARRGRIDIVAEARFLFGLANLNKNPGEAVRTRTLVFLLGFRF